MPSLMEGVFVGARITRSTILSTVESYSSDVEQECFPTLLQRAGLLKCTLVIKF